MKQTRPENERVSRDHPVQRALLAEELLRLRRSSEHRRYAAPQRAGRIDANPHQIEAVVFALSRIPDGGCVLADEVGLGKTIEAGLVIAQLWAEGRRRVLLITPKALLGQWSQELYDLFGIEARQAAPEPAQLRGEGIFLMGREAATGSKGRDAILASPYFDLCIVDEAHEIFAGIHKRFDKFGDYRKQHKDARMAGRLREILRNGATPALLLTATPIQNNLKELWGLVHFIDPMGTLLGNVQTFKQVFCPDDDRVLAVGQEQELRRRIRKVVQRTLRRQAQEFLEKPFVGRQARLFEYRMSDEERALYDDVTEYLLDPQIAAFRGSYRHLLLIGFHRRMASSTRALSASLRKVADRLERMLSAEAEPPDADEVLAALIADLEDDELASQPARDVVGGGGFDPDEIRDELQRVESFIERADALGHDGKARALLDALRLNLKRKTSDRHGGKMVIFTESLVTQDYLVELLTDSGLVAADEITVFRGTNTGPAVQRALKRWEADVLPGLPGHAIPGPEIRRRLALVHEFRTYSKIFISTEAGAKGLNLQFCNTVVNYDLPWNPQRIEQRIGRCHRYGQTRDVTVINFIARDNEAQRLTFDILMQKLDLFGTVLDASDQVLHRSGSEQPEMLAGALGAEFETRLTRIYERARSIDEIEDELRTLREDLDSQRIRFEEIHRKTAGLIEETFDDRVRQAFRQHQRDVPKVLAELDLDLHRTVASYLRERGVSFEDRRSGDEWLLEVAPDESLPPPLDGGLVVAVGRSAEHESLHLAHPLVQTAVADAREAAQRVDGLRVTIGRSAAPVLLGRQGERGRLVLLRLRQDGFEAVEQILPVIVLGDATALEPGVARALMRCPMSDAADLRGQCFVDDEAVEDAIEEVLFDYQTTAGLPEQQRLEEAMEQVERFVEDRLLLMQRDREALQRRTESATQKRDTALGAEARTTAERALEALESELEQLDADIEKLERREDEDYHAFRERIYRKRYAKPAVTRLLDIPLELA